MQVHTLQVKLILVKNLPNDDGGTAVQGDFPVFISSDPSTWGEHEVNAGSYTVSETTQPGYAPSTWGQDCAADGSVTLLPGQTKTCAITNDDIAPQLTLVKEVVNDNGGTAVASDWTLTADPESGSTISGDGTVSEDAVAGVAYSLGEDGPDNYSVKTDWSCDGGTFDTEKNTITLALAQDVTCTIVNDDDAPKVTIIKYTDPEEVQGVDFDFTLTNNDLTGNFSLDTDTETAQSNEKTFTQELSTGSVNISETLPAGWSSNVYIYCEGAEYAVNDLSVDFEIGLGDEVTCVFTNTQQSKVIVTKYNDLNRNGTRDEDEDTLPGWEINLDEATQTTGEDGSTTFENVEPYEPYEVSENLQDGWNLSDISCDSDEQEVPTFDQIIRATDQSQLIDLFQSDGHFVYPYAGQTVRCEIGNYHDVVLNLTKSNNRPAPTVVGDTVTYTLVASLDEISGALFETSVTDLPPEGFNYVPGSWTANSSVRGDLKAANITTEPTYGSPGSWNLGTMIPGEVVTLTYQTLIASTASAGTYPDIAFAAGCDIPSGEGDCDVNVLSNVSAGADSPFVATNVTIKAPQVLGASTTVLVNTGLSDMWRTMMAATLLIGLAFATLALRQKKGAQS
jgi:uncharacterized repeat protein (TIGR01451 family)